MFYNNIGKLYALIIHYQSMLIQLASLIHKTTGHI